MAPTKVSAWLLFVLDIKTYLRIRMDEATELGHEHFNHLVSYLRTYILYTKYHILTMHIV